jgi:hypothetical protein
VEAKIPNDGAAVALDHDPNTKALDVRGCRGLPRKNIEKICMGPLLGNPGIQFTNGICPIVLQGDRCRR